ncbi:MAG: type IX secretion system protein PorQ [Muribaculaceae bacterium]|nr:type IX secretion system protein PorQ [Muribaculaceae bacterium]
MKEYFRILILIFIATVLSSLVGTSAQDGSTAYNFMNVTSSARIYGMGGVNISNVVDDLSSTDQNPGLLGQEMSGQIMINYMRYVGSSNFAGIRYAHSTGNYGTWSAGLQYFGYGSMKMTDETGVILGSFSPKDVLFSGSFSYDIYGGWRGGIGVKIAYSSYEQYTALALATDLGVNYFDPDRDLSFSIVASNLGGQLKKFNETNDRLPIDLRLGWSQSFGTFPVRFSVTAWNLTKWHLPYLEIKHNGTSSQDDSIMKDSFSSNLFRHLVFGAELISSDNFYITLGYNYKTRTDMSTYQRSFLSGFSLGAGINARRFRVGLAFSQPHTGATTFMLNMTLQLQDILN